VPRLACDTFLKDIKGSKLVIEPLRKFPVIKDLVVDRGIIQENLKKASTYIGEYEHDDKYSQELEYLIGRCLKCGLCLEACPNYVKGDNFFGPMFADDSYFINARSKGDKEAIKRNYDIKDYGNIIPGHGGILDRFDSVIITAPIIYYFAVFLSRSANL
ncbi:MAG: phosphatidate cytidylyltransferase, partial [Lachnospiraceae bacterium]|nr:phosphatidate cytidylyltransferase [Lachnospiraceae bacterium]